MTITIVEPHQVDDRTSRFTGRHLFALAGWIVLCFLPAFTAIFVSTDGWYATLHKPVWNPPAWVFGPVWTSLYLMMGVSAWLVWREDGWRRFRLALCCFLAQLGLNALWTPLFFGAHRVGLALLEISVLWLIVALTLVQFWRAKKAAGILLIPYLVWLTIAAGLNFSIWRLNP